MRVASSILSLVGFAAFTTFATAATGSFQYRYDLALPAELIDPASGNCINVPEATEVIPAHSPKDLTDSTATVFLDFDCAGDTFYVLGPGKSAMARLKFRSVTFS